jgi:hypothetical protein
MPPLADDDLRLCKPGEVADATRDPPRYPLEQVLGMPEELSADLWLDHAEGLFVFGVARDSTDGAASLYFLPRALFRRNGARLLASPLPPLRDWLDVPVALGQGLFLLTAGGLHFFPSHGREEPFVARRWEPRPGERLLAFAEDAVSGQIALLQRSGSGGLTLAIGNAQSEEWPTRFVLDYDGAGTGFEIGFIPGADSRLWLYDGASFMEVQLAGGADTPIEPQRVAGRSKLTLDGGFIPPTNVLGRARAGYFKPFVICPTPSSAVFVYPKRSSTVELAQPAILTLTHPDPAAVTVATPPGSWVMPNAHCESFICGSHGGLLAFQSRAAATVLDKTVLVERSLVLGRRWIVGLAERHAAGPAGQGPPHPTVVTYAVERTGAVCNVKKSGQAALPMPGEVPRGLPPFRRGTSIFVPIRQGDRSNVRTTVYQLQLLRE